MELTDHARLRDNPDDGDRDTPPADPTITTDARAILDRLPPITLGH